MKTYLRALRKLFKWVYSSMMNIYDLFTTSKTGFKSTTKLGDCLICINFFNSVLNIFKL